MLTNHPLQLTQGTFHVMRYARYMAEDLYIRDQVPHDACELQESRHWLKNIDLRDINVVDIGAGVGTFTMLAIRQRAAHVLACEPDQGRFNVLQFNAARCGGIRPVRMALGAKSEHATMTWKVEGMVTTQHSIVTLPLAMMLYVKPNFIKISAQGAEKLWTGPPLPNHVRRLLVKTDDRGLEQADRLLALMPGAVLRRPYTQFPWSGATWLDYRRDA